MTNREGLSQRGRVGIEPHLESRPLPARRRRDTTPSRERGRGTGRTEGILHVGEQLGGDREGTERGREEEDKKTRREGAGGRERQGERRREKTRREEREREEWKQGERGRQGRLTGREEERRERGREKTRKRGGRRQGERTREGKEKDKEREGSEKTRREGLRQRWGGPQASSRVGERTGPCPSEGLNLKKDVEGKN